MKVENEALKEEKGELKSENEESFSTFNFQFSITEYEEVVSTNLVAADKRYRHGDVIVARSQSAGRGQRGNVWLSEPGANLTFSVVLEPDSMAANAQFHISKIAALSVADALGAFGVEAAIKWPNDIYVGDCKIAGILIENDIMDGRVVRSIVGTGINVNQSVFDPALPNPVSLTQLTGRREELPAVLDIFLGFLSKRWSAASDEIDEAYRSRLYRGVGEHLFSTPCGETFRASIEEILPTGAILLRHSTGEVKGYFFKEVLFLT